MLHMGRETTTEDFLIYCNCYSNSADGEEWKVFA